MECRFFVILNEKFKFFTSNLLNFQRICFFTMFLSVSFHAACQRKHEPWQFAHLTTGSMSLVRVVIWKSVSQNRLSLSLFPSITHTLTKIDFLSHTVNDFPRIINDPVLPVNVCESCASFGEESFFRNKQKKNSPRKGRWWWTWNMGSSWCHTLLPSRYGAEHFKRERKKCQECVFVWVCVYYG